MTDSVYPVKGPLFQWPLIGHKQWLRQSQLHSEEVEELVIDAEHLTFRCKSRQEFTPNGENIVIEVFARRPDQVKSIELNGQINGQAWSNKILMAGTSLLGGTLEMKGKLLKRSKNFGLLAKDLQRCYESIVAVKNV